MPDSSSRLLCLRPRPIVRLSASFALGSEGRFRSLWKRRMIPRAISCLRQGRPRWRRLVDPRPTLILCHSPNFEVVFVSVHGCRLAVCSRSFFGICVVWLLPYKRSRPPLLEPGIPEFGPETCHDHIGKFMQKGRSSFYLLPGANLFHRCGMWGRNPIVWNIRPSDSTWRSPVSDRRGRNFGRVKPPRTCCREVITCHVCWSRKLYRSFDDSWTAYVNKSRANFLVDQRGKPWRSFLKTACFKCKCWILLLIEL